MNCDVICGRTKKRCGLPSLPRAATRKLMKHKKARAGERVEGGGVSGSYGWHDVYLPFLLRKKAIEVRVNPIMMEGGGVSTDSCGFFL